MSHFADRSSIQDVFPEAGTNVVLPAAGRRDTAIDTLRGICIVLMVAAHIATGSILHQMTHPSLWVDGASGFVLLSGVLVGIVQRSTRERLGEQAGVRKLGKRIGVVYAGHLWLCLTAFVVVALNPARDEILPSVEDQGGLVVAVLRTLTLQINPHFASILSMYVVLMIVAIGSIVLLRRGCLWLLIVISMMLLAFGNFYPQMTVLPREAGVSEGMTLASWNAIFTLGLVGGWFWRTQTMRSFMSSRVMFWVSGFLAIVGAVVSRGINRTPLGSFEWMDNLFAKNQMGVGRIILSVLTYYFLYRVLRLASTRVIWRRLLTPITFLGKRSLDSYLILSTVVLALPAAWVWSTNSAAGISLAGIVLFVCLAWGWCRSGFRMYSVPAERR